MHRLTLACSLALTAVLALATSAQGGVTLNFDFIHGVNFGSSSFLDLNSNTHSFAAPLDSNAMIDATAFAYNDLTFTDNDSDDYDNNLPSFLGSTSVTSVGTSAVVLALKDAGGGEQGLGMDPDPNHNHEISLGQSIALDFSSLKSYFTAHNESLTKISFLISSAQEHEGYYLFGSSKTSLDGATETLLSNNINHQTNSEYTIDITNAGDLSKYNDFIFTAYGSGNNNHPNILINTMSVEYGPLSGPPPVNPIPEPSMLCLWALGLTGLIGRKLRGPRSVAS